MCFLAFSRRLRAFFGAIAGAGRFLNVTKRPLNFFKILEIHYQSAFFGKKCERGFPMGRAVTAPSACGAPIFENHCSRHFFLNSKCWPRAIVFSGGFNIWNRPCGGCCVLIVLEKYAQAVTNSGHILAGVRCSCHASYAIQPSPIHSPIPPPSGFRRELIFAWLRYKIPSLADPSFGTPQIG